jgi:hypothetical protein
MSEVEHPWVFSYIIMGLNIFAVCKTKSNDTITIFGDLSQLSPRIGDYLENQREDLFLLKRLKIE